MDIKQLEVNVMNTAGNEPAVYTPHKISVSDIPLMGLIWGAIPMILILFSRFGCLMAFCVLPISSAVVVTLITILMNYYFTPPTDLRPGVLTAHPQSLLQSRISRALQPFVNYEPPWWCIDAHWATLLPILLFKLPRRMDMLFQPLDSADGCRLTLEWFIPQANVLSGVVIAIPGLNGSSNGGYMVDLVQRMSEKGYAVAALNGRGSGCSTIDKLESSFHLGRSEDLLCALEGVERVCSGVPVYFLGYSAGGIRAVTFGAIYGDLLVNRVAAILSFGGTVSNEATMTFRSSVLAYQPVIMQAYTSTFLSKLPTPTLLPRETMHAIHNFVQFDTQVTTQIHNFTLDEYYGKVFAKKKWPNIAVPTLIVNAIDDPVLHVSDAIVAEMALCNSHVTLLATAKGGHIGWPSGWDQEKNGYRWISDVAQTYMNVI